jgi:hypothetical protein
MSTQDPRGRTGTEHLSVCIVVEPIFGPDVVQWRGLAFVGGCSANNIIGADRAVVFEDCVDAAQAAIDGAC